MKLPHWILLTLVIIASAWLIINTSEIQPRVEEKIDLNWKFMLEDDSSFSNLSYDDSHWQVVSLPHDWMITQQINEENESGTAGGFYPGGVGWYRKHLDLSEYESKDQFYLEFDGIYMNADVWINGEHLGTHNYGYIGFNYDISTYIRKDTINIIAVRTDCSEVPSDRWYSGAGIYRHVKLIATEKLHFPVLNTRITTRSEGALKIVSSDIEIVNADRRSKRFKIKTDLLDPDGKLINSNTVAKTIDGRSTFHFNQDYKVEDPMLWSTKQPNQYQLRTFLIHRKRVIDDLSQNFGIRDIEFSKDSGFILNGEKIWLKGVCIHHDGGALGAAVPDATWEYRLKSLKEIGVNALRLAHNPHSPEVLDLCDKLGILVIGEIYDKWEMQWGKEKSGFNFTETYIEDLSYFIRRDINHPSVIAWSMGNETVEQLDEPKKGVKWYATLAEIAHSIDSSRMITCALHPAYKKDEQDVAPSNYIHIEPLVSYNYRSEYFKDWHEEYPEIIWLASETKSYNETKVSDYNHISYLNNSWLDMETFVAGQFIWAGIDYLGESAGWPYRSFYNGLLKTNAKIKPFAYYTQSIYAEEPMVKIVVVDKELVDSLNNEETWQISWSGAPVVRHWNFEDHPDELQVIVYTNCPEVELRLNDSLCNYLFTEEYDDGVIKTIVDYEQGKISAKAYYLNENGSREYVSDSILTASAPSIIIMEPDKTEMYSDGADVVHIETRVADSIGTTYPKANHLIRYEVHGPGKIKVIDNGDPADNTAYNSEKKRVHQGTQLVILQSNLEPGDLIISASAEGLKPASLQVKSVPIKNQKKKL